VDVQPPLHRALDPERLQRLAERAAAPKHQADWRDQPGHIIDTALLILSDGHPRTGDEIWAEARRRHLLATTPKKDVYVALVGYIERHSGQGRWPSIVQNIDRRFRLNHTIDDWPDPKHRFTRANRSQTSTRCATNSTRRTAATTQPPTSSPSAKRSKVSASSCSTSAETARPTATSTRRSAR
jgi:hypothetical protein